MLVADARIEGVVASEGQVGLSPFPARMVLKTAFFIFVDTDW